MHTLICVTFSLPSGLRDWLRLLLVALPELFFCEPFYFSMTVYLFPAQLLLWLKLAAQSLQMLLQCHVLVSTLKRVLSQVAFVVAHVSYIFSTIWSLICISIALASPKSSVSAFCLRPTMYCSIVSLSFCDVVLNWIIGQRIEILILFILYFCVSIISFV